MEPAYRVELVAICGLVERLESYAAELAKRYGERARAVGSSDDAKAVLQRISSSLELVARTAGEVKAVLCTGGAGRAAVLRAYDRIEKLYYRILASEVRVPTTIRAWLYELLARMKRIM